jgi:hypothetical protein
VVAEEMVDVPGRHRAVRFLQGTPILQSDATAQYPFSTAASRLKKTAVKGKAPADVPQSLRPVTDDDQNGNHGSNCHDHQKFHNKSLAQWTGFFIVNRSNHGVIRLSLLSAVLGKTSPSGSAETYECPRRVVEPGFDPIAHALIP